MKVLHITSKDFSPNNIIGGIATVLLQQVKYENQLENIESKIVVYNSTKLDNDYFLNIANDINQIIKWKPDIVIFHGFYYIHHLRIAKKLLKNKIKYYIKPHSSFSAVSQQKSKIKKKIARILLLNRYVQKADGCIYLNNEEKYQSIYSFNNSIIMPNGIEKQNILVENNILNEEKKYLEFVYLGRIDLFHKGLDILLETLSKYQDILRKNKIKFIFYGYGRSEDMKCFETKISKLSKIAEYRGVVSSEDKYRILNQHDIFILLSRLEGMPMAILEALMCGKPCLITKETNFGDEIMKNSCGWITELNSNSIITSIVNIKKSYDNKVEFNKFEQKCKKLSENYYWENILRDYEINFKTINK